MTIHFWSNEPAILFNKEYIFELWPTKDMCYEQKMNAITRLIILMTILGYILTSSIKILSVGALTILIIFTLFTMRKQKISKKILDEGFKIHDTKIEDTEQYYDNPVTLDSVLRTEFKEGTKKNPFSNVLLPQINDDPERKSAPPSFNVSVSEDITRNIKKAVQMLNPEIKNTDKQLFGDMFQEFELDQSNRQFFSAPNTRVMNDQGAFAKYLYDDLKFSSKESTPEGAIARVQDSFRYNLY